MRPFFPLDWPAFSTSPRVLAMKEFQRYWYLALLAEAHLNHEKPGYVPNNLVVLCRLAGCVDFNFFRRYWQPVRACLRESLDGKWLYNDRGLQLSSQQNAPGRGKAVEKFRRKTLNSGDSAPLQPPLLITNSVVVGIYQDYPRKEGKRKALESIQGAIKRKARTDAITEELAAGLIWEAVKVFAGSPAGSRRSKHGENLVPHPATWFNQDRFDDDRQEWFRESGQGASVGALYA